MTENFQNLLNWIMEFDMTEMETPIAVPEPGIARRVR